MPSTAGRICAAVLNLQTGAVSHSSTPPMPDEPLIFVEVALTLGIPGSVQNLLSEERAGILADDADTAVFYSISNCQAGLAGISLAIR